MSDAVGEAMLTEEDQVMWWIQNETADNVVGQIVKDRQRIRELEAQIASKPAYHCPKCNGWFSEDEATQRGVSNE